MLLGTTLRLRVLKSGIEAAISAAPFFPFLDLDNEEVEDNSDERELNLPNWWSAEADWSEQVSMIAFQFECIIYYPFPLNYH